MKAAAIEVPVVSFAMQDREADVYAERVKYSVWETEILIRTPLGKLQVRALARSVRCVSYAMSMLHARSDVMAAPTASSRSAARIVDLCHPNQHKQSFILRFRSRLASKCHCERGACQCAQAQRQLLEPRKISRVKAHTDSIKSIGAVPQIITPLLGRFNVYNVLAAVAVGIALDISLHVRTLQASSLSSTPDPSFHALM